jgi:hypothetical protein
VLAALSGLAVGRPGWLARRPRRAAAARATGGELPAGGER